MATCGGREREKNGAAALQNTVSLFVMACELWLSRMICYNG